MIDNIKLDTRPFRKVIEMLREVLRVKDQSGRVNDQMLQIKVLDGVIRKGYDLTGGEGLKKWKEKYPDCLSSEISGRIDLPDSTDEDFARDLRKYKKDLSVESILNLDKGKANDKKTLLLYLFNYVKLGVLESSDIILRQEDDDKNQLCKRIDDYYTAVIDTIEELKRGEGQMIKSNVEMGIVKRVHFLDRFADEVDFDFGEPLEDIVDPFTNLEEYIFVGKSAFFNFKHYDYLHSAIQISDLPLIGKSLVIQASTSEEGANIALYSSRMEAAQAVVEHINRFEKIKLENWDSKSDIEYDTKQRVLEKIKDFIM